MRRFLLFFILLVFVGIFCSTSCRRKSTANVVPADTSNYPDSIASILVNKCAIAGCHNPASYQNASGLELDTWAHLFNGNNFGTVVVAYSTAYSSLLPEINPDSTLGPTVDDPPHNTLLTNAQYVTLSNWIKKGSPDINGNIPFASNPDTRQKIYLTNQGCNLVAVIDAQSKQVMRYIPVGDANNQTPHDITISSDGAYAYVPLYDGNMVQKIDTRTDAIVSTAYLNSYTPGGSYGQWSIVTLSPQDTALMVSGFLQTGSIATINTAAMQLDPKKSIVPTTSGAGSIMPWPHGLANNPTFDTFFAALQYGNAVFKFGFAPRFWYKYVSVNGQPIVLTNSSDSTNPNPHQIEMSPDNSRYFVSCQQTGMVSVIDAHTDSLIAQIPVGFYPQEMTVSTSKNYLLVACMEDANNPNYQMIGSVYVIDYNSLNVVARIYGNFYEPHDLAVDEIDGLIFIASRNASVGGIPSHHSTVCGGNAGFYNVYNLNTLQPADNKRYEVTRDAYAIAQRF